jgi:hypothetical protein
VAADAAAESSLVDEATNGFRMLSESVKKTRKEQGKTCHQDTKTCTTASDESTEGRINGWVVMVKSEKDAKSTMYKIGSQEVILRTEGEAEELAKRVFEISSYVEVYPAPASFQWD